MNRQSKDRVSAEYLFASITSILEADKERKENAMNTIAILLLIRVIVPVGILLGFGEWIRRREANYWSRR